MDAARTGGDDDKDLMRNIDDAWGKETSTDAEVTSGVHPINGKRGEKESFVDFRNLNRQPPANDQLPEEGTTAEPDVADVQAVTREEAKEIRPEIVVTAQDSSKPGDELFMEIADREGFDIPHSLRIVSGEDAPSENIYMPFENGVVCAVTSPGQEIPTNRDAVSVRYDKTRGRVRIVLVHGRQGDPKAVNIATTGAVKAALEDMIHPDQNLIQLADNVKQNISTVAMELGVQGEEAITLAELDVSAATPTLSLINRNNHCIITNPQTGEFREATPMFIFDAATTLPRIYDDLAEAYKKRFESPDSLVISEKAKAETEAARLAGTLMRYLERDLTKKQAQLMIKYVQKNLDMREPTRNQVLDVLVDFFENGQKVEVMPGEVVVIVNNALMDSLPTLGTNRERRILNFSLADMITTGVHTPGKGLMGVCKEVIANGEKLQENGIIDDEGLSIIAFEVPGTSEK